MTSFEEITPTTRDLPSGETLGVSREGRPIDAFRFGRGDTRISLIGGCHADEPVGPRLLRNLCITLASVPDTHPLVQDTEWWIIPHLNPDGAERNRGWQDPDATSYDPIEYLTTVVRERPGDDVEFGFPQDADDTDARPETQALAAWWRTANGPFALHVSLHGMAYAAGPWVLIDAAWATRCDALKERCREETARLGYVLHDVERRGEKGFERLERGFCTRPSSTAMRRHFEAQGDPETAALFRPSSMETVRALGGDPLTLVTEMPLFLTPGVGETLGPPDPVATAWRDRLTGWQGRLASGADPAEMMREIETSGLRPMPVEDQLRLQWTVILAGRDLVTGNA